MGSLEKGAWQAVNVCTKVSHDENVVVITDQERFRIGVALANEVKKAGAAVTVFRMEDFGERPADSSRSLAFPETIGAALDRAQVSFFAAGGRPGELQSFRQPMLDRIKRNKNLRHGHMIGITEQIMAEGMSLDYEKISALSHRVYDAVHKAHRIRVTSPAGTDITALFSPDFRWVISDGLIGPGQWMNLPDGEVFTCAESVEEGSVVVVDGTVGDYFDQKYGPLEKTPLHIELKDSRIAGLECENKELVEEFRRYTLQDETANRLGEFAIGTALGLERLIGNLLQDEKYPGVHVAFGDGYPDKTGSSQRSKGHVDVVLQRTTIEVDGREIMRAGEFLL